MESDSLKNRKIYFMKKNSLFFYRYLSLIYCCILIFCCKHCPPCYDDYFLDDCYATFMPYQMNEEVIFVNVSTWTQLIEHLKSIFFRYFL
jgi:hypothetical protein